MSSQLGKAPRNTEEGIGPGVRSGFIRVDVDRVEDSLISTPSSRSSILSPSFGASRFLCSLFEMTIELVKFVRRHLVNASKPLRPPRRK